MTRPHPARRGLNRRQALASLAGSGVAGGAFGAHADTAPARFVHGVASGDPYTDSVLLWTRITPPAGAHLQPVRLRWEVSEGADFARLTASGDYLATHERDHTVKVVAEGLQPGRWYHYRFVSEAGEVSPVGRTRTLPPHDSRDPVVWAVASCSLHPNGYFNAYQAIADLDQVDAVLHLGDYIYEYGAAPSDYGMRNGLALGRVPEPAHEIVTLGDYRQRHAQYKADPQLQAAHARAPWIVVYDDHEITNDPWVEGAQNHQPELEGDWATRKATALRAYYEWMPIRDPGTGVGLSAATMRDFRFGQVASLHMVETRLLARTRQLSYGRDLNWSEDASGRRVADVEAFERLRQDPSRQLLGESQIGWIEASTRAAVDHGCVWQVLGNQVVTARVRAPNLRRVLGDDMINMALASVDDATRPRLLQMVEQYDLGLPVNLDSWDGYPAERERLYGALRRAGARPVVLAGDSHSFWVNTLSDEAGEKLGIEFGTTAISSPSPSASAMLPGFEIGQVIAAQNEEVEYVDFGPRGFLKLTLTPEAVTGELVGVSTINEPRFQTSVIRSYSAEATSAGVGPLRQV